MDIMKKIISTESAPRAIGPYSQAVRAGDLLFISGQLALDPATMDLRGATAAEQAEAALRNMGAILEAAGLTFADVVKTTVLLKDIADFAPVNEVYGRYFAGDFPARAAYAAAALPRNALVEIEAVAVYPR
jgi:2-iminobutanoate/2-iminopropanoate deaminase